MNTQWGTLQDLVREVDDTRILYQQLVDRIAAPGPRRLLRRMVRTHAVVAENLADRIYAGGEGDIARTGRHWRSFKRAWANLHASFTLDPDRDRLRFVKRSEVRMLRHFDGAISNKDMHIRCRLQLYKVELESNCGELDRLISAMSYPSPVRG